MKTIEQHEEERPKLRQRSGPCGIECPQCGEELWAEQGGPPRRPVHCFGCNWSGSVTE